MAEKSPLPGRKAAQSSHWPDQTGSTSPVTGAARLHYDGGVSSLDARETGCGRGGTASSSRSIFARNIRIS